MINEEKLLNLKKKLEEAKTERSKLEGKLSLLYAQLQTLGCKSIEDGEKAIAVLKKESEKLETEIQNKIKEFEEKYKL
jgi:hypothetical protein